MAEIAEQVMEVIAATDSLYEVESAIHQHFGSDGSSDEHNDFVHDMANAVLPLAVGAVLDALGLKQVGWWNPGEKELHYVEEHNPDCDLLGCVPAYLLTGASAAADPEAT